MKTEPTPPPSLLLKGLAFVARWSLALMLLTWFLFAASWGALHWLIVPRIGEFRPQLEVRATRLLGMPVRIGAISAYSTNLLPAFELRDVRLLDDQGRYVLSLPRVLVSLSPRSVMQLKFDQILVDSPVLDVRRATDGRIFVAGLDLSGPGTEPDPALLDAVFSQPEFVIRHGAVVWTDEMRDAAPLALDDVDFVMRNSSRSHVFRLDATPPPGWGQRFGLRARFTQPFLSRGSGRWQDWSGRVHADFPSVDVAQLKRHAALAVDVGQGRGAVRVWADVDQARVSATTVDVALADVALRLDPELPALRLASFSGRLDGQFAADGFEFATKALAFDTADGLHWPGGNLRLKLQDAQANRPALGELVADRLDLSALRQIAAGLPLGAPLHRALERHAPAGLVDQVALKWSGAPDAPDKYDARGRVQRLFVRSVPAPPGAEPGSAAAIGIPGIRGATVDFAFTEAGGKASVSMQDGSLDFPGVFEQAVVPMQQLSSDLGWKSDQGRLQVQSPAVRFRNADAEGELQFSWRESDPAQLSGRGTTPGVLDMQGTMSRAQATRVHRYLPLGVSTPAREYVRDAILAGDASGVRFKVKGDLHDFPYANARLGEFFVSAHIRNGALAYVPVNLQDAGEAPWPALAQLSGELVIDRHSLRIVDARAQMATAPALQVTRADVSIADMVQASPVVVQTDARGPLADMLGLVNQSPLASMTDGMLARASATGNAELRLRLVVPLEGNDRTTVQGSVTLGGNDLVLSPEIPRLLRARGSIAFSESGFSVSALQARALGGDMRLDGGTVPSNGSAAGAARAGQTLAFRLQGVASMEGLRQARELGGVGRLAQFATGSAAYTATLGVRAGRPELSLSSNLVGIALAMPAPLGKTADAPLALRLESSLVRESPVAAAGGAARLQDQLLLDLGGLGSVQYVRDVSGTEPRVLRGAISVGIPPDEAVVLPRAGVVANIRLGDVNLDAWDTVLSRLTADPQAAAPTAQENAAVRAYWPDVLAVRARVLSTGGRSLHNLVAGGSRDGNVWRANLEADELGGYAEYRQSGSAGGAGRLFARLSRLTLAQTSATAFESLLDDQPANIPALDVIVEDLELRGKKLGRLEVEAINRLVGPRADGAREWRLNKFDVVAPEAIFRATGNWAALHAQSAGPTSGAPRAGQGDARRTVMNFRLDIQNAGDFLARLGIKDVVRRGKGTMEGQVAWAGSPLSLDYASLGGAFSVNVENGQFLKADPGLAKLLGVLSLQSLPRRLALDFRDVFSEGFVFDYFRGDIRIDAGVARSDNLQMKGVNAAVLMDGQADLFHETQDLRVVVVPEINAGTASLIASAINPAIGLGTFLAQFVLRKPLMEAATQEFHIDGTWVDPRIQRVERKVVAPVNRVERNSGATMPEQGTQ